VSARFPPLNFRLKLFLAMMLVVTGVTGAALLVTQQEVAATYAKIFQERFRTEVELFAAAQEARLTTVKDKCRELARSVRLIAALEEGDTTLLYKIAFDELREVVSPEVPPRALRPATFFRLSGADGRVLSPPDARAGLASPADRREFEASLTAAARGLSADDPQTFGYLALAVGDGRRELHEVVLTRLVDSVGSRPLGTLAIGFPLPEAATGATSTALRSALWVGGVLYSKTLPEATRRDIARQIAAGGSAGGELVTAVDDIPHRVLFRALSRGEGFPPAEQVSLYSLAEPLAEQARLRARVCVFGALGLAAAFFLSLRISRGLSVPIHELVAGTAEIQRGNFAVQVPLRSRDELGHLAGSFNAMARELELKERVRNVLDLIADKDVAAELMSGRLSLGGELRDVSILFCDIRGFTAFTERMQPAEIVDFLNEHMTALTAVVYDHRGVVDKFVGDLVMAIFGAPKSYGDDAYNAVRCAQGMIAARQRLNVSSRYCVTVGIGIASGTVVAGRIGSKDRLSYTVLGERVNLASRLCATAGSMEILIDDATHSRISGAIPAAALPGLTLKGFTDAMPAYRIAALEMPEPS
jgi:class 3 adenylate cyclase